MQRNTSLVTLTTVAGRFELIRRASLPRLRLGPRPRRAILAAGSAASIGRGFASTRHLPASSSVSYQLPNARVHDVAWRRSLSWSGFAKPAEFAASARDRPPLSMPVSEPFSRSK
jgi:hypothetical protein